MGYIQAVRHLLHGQFSTAVSFLPYPQVKDLNRPLFHNDVLGFRFRCQRLLEALQRIVDCFFHND